MTPPNVPRYIETVPKLGYRMIVPVETDQSPQVTEAKTTPPATIEETLGGKHIPPNRTSQGSRVRRWAVVLGISIVLIGGLVGYVKWSRLRERPQPTAGRLMLAVLPFENLTGDAGQDYFSDGMTEEMIWQLGRIDPDHVGVIARTSVMHYKHSQEPLDADRP